MHIKRLIEIGSYRAIATAVNLRSADSVSHNARTPQRPAQSTGREQEEDPSKT